MRIEGDAGGGDGDCGESGTGGPDGMDLDIGGRYACGSDGDGGEDGSMGLEADAGAASEVKGDADGAGEAAAPAAAPKAKKKTWRGRRAGRVWLGTIDAPTIGQIEGYKQVSTQ
jgi:hypothetical protein